ncbi:hypothetical protein LEMLEM_LOCUS19466 [Lemmus lemmus]
MRGHLSVIFVRKASIKFMSSKFMRPYTSQRSLSHVALVAGPSATRPICRLMRGFTQERSPTPALCVIIGSASHPHTTVTRDLTETQTNTNVRNVSNPSSIPVIFPFTRKYKRRRGHLYVQRVIKDSVLTQT